MPDQDMLRFAMEKLIALQQNTLRVLCNVLDRSGSREFVRALEKLLHHWPGDMFPWLERDGVIRFSLVSNGKTGNRLINFLERSGLHIDEMDRVILRAAKFSPISAEKINVVILKGNTFSPDTRTLRNVCARAKEMSLKMCGVEVSCLILDKFTRAEIISMGLRRIVVFHRRVSHPLLIGIECGSDELHLKLFNDDQDEWWESDTGFAFIA